MTASDLEARSLSKKYGRHSPWALDSIDVQLQPGEIVALVGPNGAGKSTLVRCLMGFEAPTARSVRIHGVDPLREPAKALLRVGYVAQGAPLYADLSPSDHLHLASVLRPAFDVPWARRRIDALGIDGKMPAAKLSGGQRAQVALTIALATKAQILIFDEPVANLDPMARRSFLGFVREEAKSRNATVLIASHIVTDLVGVCDSIIILAPGRVVLCEKINVALSRHSVVPGTTRSDRTVSTFQRADGTWVSLTAVDGAGNTELEDLVVGYLAAMPNRT